MPAPSAPNRELARPTGAGFGMVVAVLAFLVPVTFLFPVTGEAQRGIDLAAPQLAPPSGFALDVGVRATAPLSVGAMMQLEMPGRIFGRVELGGLPDGVADAYTDVASSFGGWDAATSAAVRDALGGAVFFETALGLRPIPDAGLELSVGYALLWTACRMNIGGVGGTIESSLHAIHANLGWRALIGDFAFFLIEAGWLHTLAANVMVNLDQDGYEPPGLESELSAALVSRGFTPTLAITLGMHLE